MLWECDTCGRDNPAGQTLCILCGEPAAGVPADPEPHGLARWDAGIRALTERLGEFPTPHLYGGRARLDDLSDAEIDARLAELEVDILTARQEEDEEAETSPRELN